MPVRPPTPFGITRITTTYYSFIPLHPVVTTPVVMTPVVVAVTAAAATAATAATTTARAMAAADLRQFRRRQRLELLPRRDQLLRLA